MDDLAKVSLHSKVPLKGKTRSSPPLTLAQKLSRLERIALQETEFAKCCYDIRVCHGIAKALTMLFPNGRTDSFAPSQSRVEKVRRFLKVKVKRYTQVGEATASPLPSVEVLMRPDLFSVDLCLHSHLRIQGKEVITPCILPKVIWLSVSALNLETSLKKQPNDPLDLEAELPKDSQGRYVASIHESDIPTIAQWLMHYCIIPGGPWTIYGAVCNGLAVEDEDELPTFQQMQAKLFKPNGQKQRSLPFVNTPKNIAIVYDNTK
eukprot:scaffold10501_cov141-Amphora_coffeaeformis.AAC.7